jgi:hypothetical protein
MMQEEKCYYTKDELQYMKSCGYIKLNDEVSDSLTPPYTITLENMIAAQSIEGFHCFLFTQSHP